MQAAFARAGVAALLALVAATAHAGLFDDDEARKAILELRNRVTALDEQVRKGLGEQGGNQAQLANQLTEQLAAIRRSLVDLNNQMEALRAETARLRGSHESLQRDVAELQRKQKDVVAGVDDRLRKLEPVKVTIEGREAMVDPAERTAFDEAMAVMRGGEFDKASAAFGGFLRRFPASAYADTARFWLGNAQYGRREYKEAVATFRQFVAAAPQHPRAPEALLGIANSQAEMRDKPGARKTLDELLKTYPKTDAAQAGKERLAALK